MAEKVEGGRKEVLILLSADRYEGGRERLLSPPPPPSFLFIVGLRATRGEDGGETHMRKRTERGKE